MHELSIAMSLVDAICDELPRLGDGVRVRAVRIRVGLLSGVAAEALTLAFDVATGDSPIDGARLEIEETSGRELELTAPEVVDGAALRDVSREPFRRAPGSRGRYPAGC